MLLLRSVIFALLITPLAALAQEAGDTGSRTLDTAEEEDAEEELTSSAPPPSLAGMSLLFQPDNLPSALLLTALDLTDGHLRLGVGVVPSVDPVLRAFDLQVQQGIVAQLKSVGKATIKRVRALPMPPTTEDATQGFWKTAATEGGVDNIIVARMIAVPGEHVAVELTLDLMNADGDVVKTVSALNAVVTAQHADKPAIPEELRAFYDRAWSVHSRKDVYTTYSGRGPARKQAEFTPELLGEGGTPKSSLQAGLELGTPSAIALGFMHKFLNIGLLVGGGVGCAGFVVVPLVFLLASGAVTWPVAMALSADSGNENVVLPLLVIPVGVALASVAFHLVVMIGYALGGYYLSLMAPRWLLAGLVREHNQALAQELGVDLEAQPSHYHPSGWDDGFEYPGRMTP